MHCDKLFLVVSQEASDTTRSIVFTLHVHFSEAIKRLYVYAAVLPNTLLCVQLVELNENMVTRTFNPLCIWRITEMSSDAKNISGVNWDQVCKCVWLDICT